MMRMSTRCSAQPQISGSHTGQNFFAHNLSRVQLDHRLTDCPSALAKAAVSL